MWRCIISMGCAPIVSSLEDLMRRCLFANKIKMSASGAPFETVIMQLGLPTPETVTNAQLRQLKPIYMDLINRIRREGMLDSSLQSLLHPDKPDSAILLLYFLAYPNEVRSIRNGAADSTAPVVDEAFGFADVSDAIAKDPVIGTWCRNALATPSNMEHHSGVLAKCIELLNGIQNLPSKQAKKCFKKIVLQGNCNAFEGFQKLRMDLADVVSRSDLPGEAVLYAIVLQIHLVAVLFGEEQGLEILQGAPRKEAFENELEKHRREYGENNYQLYRWALGSSVPTEEEMDAFIQQNPFPTCRKELILCEQDGCNNEGKFVCMKCKLSSYCSKDCQIADWKVRHNFECTKSAKPKKNVPSPPCTEQAIVRAEPTTCSPRLIALVVGGIAMLLAWIMGFAGGKE